jgi:hypothetical protein
MKQLQASLNQSTPKSVVITEKVVAEKLEPAVKTVYKKEKK